MFEVIRLGRRKLFKREIIVRSNESLKAFSDRPENREDGTAIIRRWELIIAAGDTFIVPVPHWFRVSVGDPVSGALLVDGGVFEGFWHPTEVIVGAGAEASNE